MGVVRELQFSILTLTLLLTTCAQPQNDKSASVPTATPTPVSSPSPAETPLSPEADVAKEEYNFQGGATFEETASVRREAADWALKQSPGWQVKGISCQEQALNTFFVDVDLYRNNESRIVSLFVEPMFKADNTYYWKVLPLTPLLLQRTTIIKQFRDLPGKVTITE